MRILGETSAGDTLGIINTVSIMCGQHLREFIKAEEEESEEDDEDVCLTKGIWLHLKSIIRGVKEAKTMEQQSECIDSARRDDRLDA